MEIDYLPAPKGRPGFTVDTTINTWRLQLDKVKPTLAPLIYADIFGIQGMLRGLSASPVDGWLQIKHAPNSDGSRSDILIDGDLDVFRHSARIIISQVIWSIGYKLAGITVLYPEIHLTAKVAYTIKWH